MHMGFDIPEFIFPNALPQEQGKSRGSTTAPYIPQDSPAQTDIGSCHEGPGFDTEVGILTTQQDYDASPSFRRAVIDHVYVYGNEVSVKLLDIPISETALLTTDHTLVISDFSIE